MNAGKTLFAQIMEFVPWTSFARIVQRYSGNSGVRTLSCAEQFRAMAFAQLTCRESLRDIEACLSANAAKLYHDGFRAPVKRSTLADANECATGASVDLAALLIRRARKLYADEPLGVDLDNTVYALDSTTIDLCLACSMGPVSKPRRPSSCTRCWTCEARSRPSSLSRRQAARRQRAGPALSKPVRST